MLRSAVLLLAFSPSVVGASCLTANTGAGCATARKVVSPPAVSEAEPPVEIGAVLPRGKYTMVMNASWYGLPPARDGWVYFRVEDDVYRVDFMTREILERATDEASGNWP